MNKIFVISGPSGSGKGTLVEKLLKDFTDLEESVSATTRKPRPGETEGKDYFFFSDDEFKRNLLEGNFLEHERVHGNKYGTLKSEVDKKLSKKDVILEIDIKGAFTIKKKYGKNSVLIFIMAPNTGELMRRLVNRKTDSLEVIKKRVKESVNEVKQADKFDYCVLNDKIDKAYKKLAAIIEKERSNS